MTAERYWEARWRDLEKKKDRLERCIAMAMGCLDPLAKRPDEALAWYRLLDAIEGREPRSSLSNGD